MRCTTIPLVLLSLNLSLNLRLPCCLNYKLTHLDAWGGRRPSSGSAGCYLVPLTDLEQLSPYLPVTIWFTMWLMLLSVVVVGGVLVEEVVKDMGEVELEEGEGVVVEGGTLVTLVRRGRQPCVRQAAAGDHLSVHYTGRLGGKDGQVGGMAPRRILPSSSTPPSPPPSLNHQHPLYPPIPRYLTPAGRNHLFHSSSRWVNKFIREFSIFLGTDNHT